ncbi:hypothetical protein D049_3993A, partial [Vibrio parahaemolyticus VPTS-2010]
MEKHTLFK